MDNIIDLSEKAPTPADPAAALRKSVSRVLAVNTELVGALEFLASRLDGVDHVISELPPADTKAKLEMIARLGRNQLFVVSALLSENHERLSGLRRLLTEAIASRGVEVKNSEITRINPR